MQLSNMGWKMQKEWICKAGAVMNKVELATSVKNIIDSGNMTKCTKKQIIDYYEQIICFDGLNIVDAEWRSFLSRKSKKELINWLNVCIKNVIMSDSYKK